MLQEHGGVKHRQTQASAVAEQRENKKSPQIPSSLPRCVNSGDRELCKKSPRVLL